MLSKHFVIGALLALSFAGAAQAQTKSDAGADDRWRGVLVMPKRDAVVKAGDKVLEDDATPSSERLNVPWQVQQAKGPLLCVDSVRNGWVPKSLVVRLEDAAEYYTGFIDGEHKAWAYAMRSMSWGVLGDREKSLADLSEYIKLQPGAPALWSRGMMWLEMGENEKALADYDEAIRLDPNYVNAYANRALVWLRKADYEKALADYDAAIRVAPKNAVLYKNRGSVWVFKREIDKAIADFDEALRLDPNYAHAYADRGAARLMQEKTDLALADYNQAIRLEADHAASFYGRANCYLLQNRLDQAFDDYRRAVELDGSWLERLKAHDDPRHQAIVARFAQAERDAAEWRGAKVMPKLDAEVKAGDRVIDDNSMPENERIQLPWVVQDVKGSLFCVGGFRNGWVDRNQVVRLNEAPQYYSGFVAGEHKAWAYGLRAAAWEFNGEPDKAIADYGQQIGLHPSAAAFYHRGNVWLGKRNLDQAIADYAEALRLDPKYLQAYNNRAAAFCLREEYDQAIDDFDQILRLYPNYANGYVNRGSAWAKKDEYDKALADYDRALDLNPNFAEAYRNRGNAWSKKKEFEKALADYDRALRLSPDSAVAHYDKACCLSRHGQLDQALESLGRAIELDGQLLDGLKADHDFDPLHGDPRFQAILDKQAK